MTTASLYDLGQDFLAIEAALLESEGELTPDVEARLEALGALEGEKVDAYRIVIRNFETKADVIATEIAALGAKKKAAEAAAQRLKDRLLGYLEARGVDKLAGSIWTACRQRNPSRPLTVHVAPEVLPEALRKTTVTVTPDREALKALAEMETGHVVVDGQHVATLEPAGSHIRFR